MTTALALQLTRKMPYHREAWSTGTELQNVVQHQKQKSSLPGPLSKGKRSVKDVVILGLERIIT